MTEAEYKELRKTLIFAKAQLLKNPKLLFTKEEYLLMDVKTAEMLLAQGMGVTVPELHTAARKMEKKINHARHHGMSPARAEDMGRFEARISSHHRCQARFPLKIDGRVDYWVSCTRAHGHVGGHAGRSRGGLSMEWTDAQAREQIRPVPRQVVGALSAWRCWRLGKHEKLMSVSASTVWDGPVMTTRVGKDGKLMRVRTEDHNHNHHQELLYEGPVDYGIHAYKKIEHLRAHWIEETLDTYPVIGRVDLTGHVCVHELGYRAQKATITELWYFRHAIEKDPFLGNVTADVPRSLEKRYGCDVHVIDVHKKDGWFKYMEAVEREDTRHLQKKGR
jgi:head-tail adaptor